MVNSVMSSKTSNKRDYSHLKQFHYKKGECGNPGGRPKKPVLPEDVSEILSTNSPTIMQKAVNVALGQNGEKYSSRILGLLLDKIKPSLKSIEYKGQSQLPTMILINSDTNPRVIEAIQDQLNTESKALIDAPPEEK